MPADGARLVDVRQFALAVAREFGFGDSECFDITTAASEAAANAIEHGCSQASDEIAIRALREDEMLAFYVTDGGSFVPRVMRGELPERGRGLRTIGQLMDEIDVRPSADGTVIRFSKRLSS